MTKNPAMENLYKITLFNKMDSTHIKTFDYPILLNVGDSINVSDDEHSNMFIIKDRMFSLKIVDNLVAVELIGNWEWENE